MPRNKPNRSPDPVEEIYRRIDRHEGYIQTDVLRRRYPTPWVNPEFLNGWVTNIAGRHPYRYCLIAPNILHDVGTIDGGASGSVAYIVPHIYRPFEGNIIWHGSVDNTILPAKFEMDYQTGEVTVTFS